MTTLRQCDVCGFARQSVVRGELVSVVRRYGLTFQRGGRGTYYGFGGIDMCDECWEKIAQPKQRRTRNTPPKHPSLA